MLRIVRQFTPNFCQREVRAVQDEGKRTKAIPSGAKGSVSLAITPEHVAHRRKDAMLPPVLAPPVMIMENAALNATKPYLDASESALGARVDVRHVTGTPAARHVRGKAQVTRVDRRRTAFKGCPAVVWHRGYLPQAIIVT